MQEYYNIKINNKFFERVEPFKYLANLANQNRIHGKDKSRLKSGNGCYHSVQNLWYSSFLAKYT